MNTAQPGSKYQTITNRIQTLEPKLRQMANRFASGDTMEADDIFSEMVEAILTKCDPDFSDAMILTKAKWVAYDHINSVRIYTKYVADAAELQSKHSEEEETYEVDYEEVNIRSSNYPNPEQALVDNETADELNKAISKLSPTLQLIVSLLKKGYKPVEIAAKLDISKSAVTQNIQRVSKSLIAMNAC